MLGVPDLTSIFMYRAVAAELPGANGVEDRLLGPYLLIFVGLVNLSNKLKYSVLSLDVGLEVLANQVLIVVVTNGVDKFKQNFLASEPALLN